MITLPMLGTKLGSNLNGRISAIDPASGIFKLPLAVYLNLKPPSQALAVALELECSPYVKLEIPGIFAPGAGQGQVTGQHVLRRLRIPLSCGPTAPLTPRLVCH
jgi:hypothetical protein